MNDGGVWPAACSWCSLHAHLEAGETGKTRPRGFRRPVAAWHRPLARDDGKRAWRGFSRLLRRSNGAAVRGSTVVAHPQRGCSRVAEQYRSWGARVFFAGRVICSASPHGHEGEASTRFLIGQHRGAAPAAIQAGSEDTLAPCVTRRGVRAATSHEKGRSGQVTGRPVQKMHVVATIAEI